MARNPQDFWGGESAHPTYRQFMAVVWLWEAIMSVVPLAAAAQQVLEGEAEALEERGDLRSELVDRAEAEVDRVHREIAQLAVSMTKINRELSEALAVERSKNEAIRATAYHWETECALAHTDRRRAQSETDAYKVRFEHLKSKTRELARSYKDQKLEVQGLYEILAMLNQELKDLRRPPGETFLPVREGRRGP
jgi:chromosome segregation ATPase